MAWPGLLYSLASLYKHAKACPASTVTRRSNLCKYERSSTSLTTFILNWACFFPPVHEIYQTADHPALPPDLGACPWRLSLASDSRGFRLSPRGKPAKYTRQALAWVGGDVRGEVWFGSFLPTACSFMMISPKLHAIWPFFFLNLSQNLIVVLLMYFGTLGDG